MCTRTVTVIDERIREWTHTDYPISMQCNMVNMDNKRKCCVSILRGMLNDTMSRFIDTNAACTPSVNTAKDCNIKANKM